MIVDSPGVGENEDMSESVLNYLPHAFCFMYVINSVNAGGIQRDRVSLLSLGYFKAKTPENMQDVQSVGIEEICNEQK